LHPEGSPILSPNSGDEDGVIRRQSGSPRSRKARGPSASSGQALGRPRPATRRLLHRDISYQVTGNRLNVLHALVDSLLLFALVAVLLHAEVEDLHAQAVE